MFDKIKTKLDEMKELKAIENESYEEEKVKVDAENLITKKEAAKQRGIAKAHKNKVDGAGNGFFDRINRASERMAEYNEKQKKEPFDLIKCGSNGKSDNEIPQLYKLGKDHQ